MREFNGVRQWVNKKDLVNKELILVVIHMKTRWCLATIDFQVHQFCYYDSLLKDNRGFLQLLQDYMGQVQLFLTGLACFVKTYHNSLMDLTTEFLCACMQDISQSVHPFHFHNLIWM